MRSSPDECNLPQALQALQVDFDVTQCQPKILQVLEYWLSIRPGTGLPGRQHFDPVDIPHLLPNLRLIDIEGPPPRFKTRLMGTVLRDFFGEEQTGSYCDEVFPDFEKTRIYRDLLETMVTKRPNWLRGHPLLLLEKDYVAIERIFLPFAADGEQVDMLLSYVLFGDKDGNFC